MQPPERTGTSLTRGGTGLMRARGRRQLRDIPPRNPVPAWWQQTARDGRGVTSCPPGVPQSTWGRPDTLCGAKPFEVSTLGRGAVNLSLPCQGAGCPSLWHQGPFPSRRGKEFGWRCQSSLGGLSSSARVSPSTQARGDTSTLQPKGASPALTCSIPHSQGTQGVPGAPCPPQCTQPLVTHTQDHSFQDGLTALIT